MHVPTRVPTFENFLRRTEKKRQEVTTSMGIYLLGREKHRDEDKSNAYGCKRYPQSRCSRRCPPPHQPHNRIGELAANVLSGVSADVPLPATVVMDPLVKILRTLETPSYHQSAKRSHLRQLGSLRGEVIALEIRGFPSLTHVGFGYFGRSSC